MFQILRKKIKKKNKKLNINVHTKLEAGPKVITKNSGRISFEYV